MTTPAAPKQKNFSFDDVFDADPAASGVDPNAQNGNYNPFEQLTLWKHPIRLFRKKETMTDGTEINNAFAIVTPLFEPFAYKPDGVEFARQFSFHRIYKSKKTYNLPCTGPTCPICKAGNAPSSMFFALVIHWNRYRKENKNNKWVITGNANPQLSFILRGNNDITNYGESVSALPGFTYRGNICRVTLKPDNPKGDKENFFSWATTQKLPKDSNRVEFNPFLAETYSDFNWIRDKDDEDQVIKVRREIKDATYEYIQHKKVPVTVRKIDFSKTYDKETQQGVKEYKLIEMPTKFPQPTAGSALETMWDSANKKYNLEREPDWNDPEDALLWAKCYLLNFPKSSYDDLLKVLDAEEGEEAEASQDSETDTFASESVGSGTEVEV